MNEPLKEVLARHRALLARHGTEKSFLVGDCLFREGEIKADNAYFIISGEVNITRQVRSSEKTLAMMGPGDILGEIAIFSPGERTASAYAHTPVTALKLSRADFQKLRSENLEAAYEILEAILNVVSTRLRSTIERLEVIYFWLS